MNYRFVFILLLCNVFFGFSQTEYIKFEGSIYAYESLNSLQKLKEKKSKNSSHIYKLKSRDVKITKDSVIHYFHLNKIFPFEEPLYFHLEKWLANRLPEFTLKMNTGTEKSSDVYIGKPSVVFLWNSSHGYQKKECYFLNELKKIYSESINTIAISNEDCVTLNDFLSKNDFQFDNFCEAGDYLKNELGVITYPNIFLLDKKGRVRHIYESITTTDYKNNEAYIKAIEKFEGKLKDLINEED